MVAAAVAVILIVAGLALIPFPMHGAARLVYVAPDSNGIDQLFAIDPAAGVSQQLTHSDSGIKGYTVAPDGRALVFIVQRADGGHDLWRVSRRGAGERRLVACAPADCTGPAWAPDGATLAFERRETPDASPYLWRVDTQGRDPAPLFDAAPPSGFGVRWSPGGDKLAYVDPEARGIQIRDLAAGSTLLLPLFMDVPPVWDPAGEALIVMDLQLGRGAVSNILRVDSETGWFLKLTSDTEVENDAPAFSPDGAWIAFRRKAGGTPMGKQIWLMHADGSDARPITQDADFYHGIPVWSPDGATLAFSRHDILNPDSPPAVWLFDLDGGALTELLSPARGPAWLPATRP